MTTRPQGMTLTPEQRREARRAAGRKGGLARAKQFTSEFQRAARARVKRESLQAAGRKGYRRACETQGPDHAARRFANWRRAHPSPLEIIVRRWLDDLNEFYVSEAVLDGYTIYPDFLLMGRGLVVECDGDGWHRMRADYDRWRDQLLRANGYTVLRLPEKKIRDGSALDTLKQQLGLNPNLKEAA